MQNQYKIALIGDSGSGKSSILKVLKDDGFSPEIQGTVGVDIFQITQVIKNIQRKFKIYDTSGCRNYELIVNRIISQVDAVIICFDSTINNYKEQIHYWESIVANELRTIPIFLLGNKIDKTKQIFDKSPSNEIYFTSAKDRINVKESFSEIFTRLCFPKTKIFKEIESHRKLRNQPKLIIQTQKSSFLLCCN